MIEPSNLDVTITPKAEKFIRRMMRFSSRPDTAFRLNVQPGGCFGFSVTFDLVDMPAEQEILWGYADLRICSNRKTCLLLQGATVDFSESISQTGFHVTVPGGTAEGCSSTASFVPVSLLSGQ